jgi:hypothetical protein
LSRTPLVAIFHQDDRMCPGHLAAQTAAFASYPGAGLVASATRSIDEDGRPVPPSVVEPGGIGSANRDFSPAEFVRLLAVNNPLRCSAVGLRTAAHATAGGFDPSYRYVVDWDFWIRVARLWGVSWLACPTVEVRWHRASETHRFRSGTTDLEETARLQHELFAREGAGWPDLPRVRTAAGRRLARAYLNRAHHRLRAGDSVQARACLARAVSLSLGIVGTIALDPRLAVQMAALSLFPRSAGRWFERPSPPAPEPPPGGPRPER